MNDDDDDEGGGGGGGDDDDDDNWCAFALNEEYILPCIRRNSVSN